MLHFFFLKFVFFKLIRITDFINIILLFLCTVMGRFKFLKCITPRQLVADALPKGYIMGGDIGSECMGSSFMNMHGCVARWMGFYTIEIDNILLPLLGRRDSEGNKFFDTHNDKLIDSVLRKKVAGLLLSFPGNKDKLNAFLQNRSNDVPLHIYNFAKMIDNEAYSGVQIAWRNEGRTTKMAEYHLRVLLESLQEGLFDKNNIFVKFLIDAESSAILLRKTRDEVYNIGYLYANENMLHGRLGAMVYTNINLILFFKHSYYCFFFNSYILQTKGDHNLMTFMVSPWVKESVKRLKSGQAFEKVYPSFLILLNLKHTQI